MLPLKLDSIFLVNFRYYLPIFQELCQTIFIRDIILFDVIRFDRNHKFIFFFLFLLTIRIIRRFEERIVRATNWERCVPDTVLR